MFNNLLYIYIYKNLSLGFLIILHQSLSKICSLLINVYIVREKFLNLLFLLSVLI